MKKIVFLLMSLALCAGAHAQPGQMPQNVILTARANDPIMYGGPTRAEGRSYNFTPVFFIYPDTKVDQAGATRLLEELALQVELVTMDLIQGGPLEFYGFAPEA